MKEQNGLLQILVGAVMVLLGAVGLAKGRSVKNRALRVTVLTASITTIACGGYVFALGVGDLAIGRLDNAPLGKYSVSALVYKNKGEFIEGLKTTFATQDIRRLRFECEDKTNSFTIYNTVLGMFNVPDEDVKCSNGAYVLKYLENK